MPFKDAQPVIHNEHHLSHLRMILEDERILPMISELAVIGLQGHKVTQSEVDLAKSHLGERLKLVYLEKDIRRAQLEED